MSTSPETPRPSSFDSEQFALLEQRVDRKLGVSLGIAIAFFCAAGALLAYFGARQREALRSVASEAQKAIGKDRDEIARLAENFGNNRLPKASTWEERMFVIERLSPFVAGPGAVPLPPAEINDWLTEKFHETYSPTQLGDYSSLFAKYNVTKTDQLLEIYGNAGLQARVDQLYLDLLKRHADPYGGFEKGIRVIRGGMTDAELQEELLTSPEATSLKKN
jgi:hypothetical protein